MRQAIVKKWLLALLKNRALLIKDENRALRFTSLISESSTLSYILTIDEKNDIALTLSLKSMVLFILDYISLDTKLRTADALTSLFQHWFCNADAGDWALWEFWEPIRKRFPEFPQMVQERLVRALGAIQAEGNDQFKDCVSATLRSLTSDPTP